MSKLQNVAELRSLVRKLNKFFDLTPEQRKKSPLVGEPKGMCEIGKELFERFCNDPSNNREFMVHYDATRCDGCVVCRVAFLRHLLLVVD